MVLAVLGYVGYVVVAWVALIAIVFSLWYFVVAPRLTRQLSDETADGYLDPSTGKYRSFDAAGLGDHDVDRFQAATEINLYAHQHVVFGQAFFWIDDLETDRFYMQLICMLIGMKAEEFLPVFGSVDPPTMQVDFYAQLGAVPLRIGTGGFNRTPFEELATIFGKTIHVYEAPLAFRDTVDEPKYAFAALPWSVAVVS